ncbi:hypothetical protein DFJ73DRAFT_774334 [Zopfochytrium polystomum]|nr:hypothetical protein DFJ73DRAFT_774334 [Zopfochytrium polystomum]
MSAPNALQVLGRVAGIIIAGPSMMTNVSSLNSIFFSYKGRPVQIAGIASTVLALITDVLILVATVWVTIDSKWAYLSQSSVAINVLKRLYSVNVVYVTALRFQAINRQRAVALLSSWPIVAYVTLYALFSATTLGFQVHAYVSNDWVAAAARASDSFRLYRILNLVTTSIYVLLGVVVDVQFMMLGKTNPMQKSNFARLRMFYNHWIYLAYELVSFAGFTVNIIWGLVDPVNVTGFVYVEQMVLSMMMLNGLSLVQVCSSQSFVSSPDGSGPPSMQSAMQSAMQSGLAIEQRPSAARNPGQDR